VIEKRILSSGKKRGVFVFKDIYSSTVKERKTDEWKIAQVEHLV
jgi:hypothetical protein